MIHICCAVLSVEQTHAYIRSHFNETNTPLCMRLTCWNETGKRMNEANSASPRIQMEWKNVKKGEYTWCVHVCAKCTRRQHPIDKYNIARGPIHRNFHKSRYFMCFGHIYNHCIHGRRYRLQTHTHSDAPAQEIETTNYQLLAKKTKKKHKNNNDYLHDVYRCRIQRKTNDRPGKASNSEIDEKDDGIQLLGPTVCAHIGEKFSKTLQTPYTFSTQIQNNCSQIRLLAIFFDGHYLRGPKPIGIASHKNETLQWGPLWNALPYMGVQTNEYRTNEKKESTNFDLRGLSLSLTLALATFFVNIYTYF